MWNPWEDAVAICRLGQSACAWTVHVVVNTKPGLRNIWLMSVHRYSLHICVHLQCTFCTEAACLFIKPPPPPLSQKSGSCFIHSAHVSNCQNSHLGISSWNLSSSVTCYWLSDLSEAGVKKSLVLEPGTSRISIRTSIYIHPMSDGQVKNYSARLLFLECPALFCNRTSKNFGVLVHRTSEHFKIFLPLWGMHVLKISYVETRYL